MEKPEGIIITISEKMLKEKGYRNWLRNFLDAMNKHNQEWTYWMRQGTQPREALRKDLQFVYLCIGGKIRYRAYFAGSYGAGEKTFGDGTRMFGSAWIVLGGPVERAPFLIERKGFRGFRYTEKLF